MRRVPSLGAAVLGASALFALAGCSPPAVQLPASGAATAAPASSAAQAPAAGTALPGGATAGNSSNVDQQVSSIDSQLKNIDNQISSASAGLNTSEGDPSR